MSRNTLSQSGSGVSRLSSTQRSVQHFQHEALPMGGRFVRLIRLLPTHHSEHLSCRLFQVDLDSLKYEYTAVSYTWGSDSPRQTILLDGIEFPVRRSLHELLHAFRHSRRVQTLWIDALCIDQTSLTERNRQINHMGEIFARANNVKAWLGKAQPVDEDAFRYINEVTNLPQERQILLSINDIERLGSSLELLESRKYWSRAWIIQELMLAQDAAFFIGRDYISWNQLVQAISMVDKTKARHLRTIIVTKYLGVGTWSFEELFMKFGHLGCADVRDKLYSLYGMVGDQSGLVKALPAPDYSLCINEVVMQHLDRFAGLFLTQGQMDFVQSFVSHAQHLNPSQKDCNCHAKATLNLKLRFHGDFREATRKPVAGQSSGGTHHPPVTPGLILHSDNDLYRFRQFQSDGRRQSLEASDYAFELNDQGWYLVYHHSGTTGKATGLARHYPNESKFFSFADVSQLAPYFHAGRLSSTIEGDQSINGQPINSKPDNVKDLKLQLRTELGFLLKLAIFMNIADKPSSYGAQI